MIVSVSKCWLKHLTEAAEKPQDKANSSVSFLSKPATFLFINHLFTNTWTNSTWSTSDSGGGDVTDPWSGWTAIARGLSTSLQTITFLISPSRSDTSILDDPESVQNNLSWIQSTATPPDSSTHNVIDSQYIGHHTLTAALGTISYNHGRI